MIKNKVNPKVAEGERFSEGSWGRVEEEGGEMGENDYRRSQIPKTR